MTQLDVASRLPSAVKFGDDAFLQATAAAHVPHRKVSLSAPVTRTAAPPKPPACTTVECSALVIGCGVAGNATALRLASRGIKVTVLSAAEDPHNCATYYAQGGIIYKSDDDSPALLASDVHRAGAGECDDAAVQKLALEGPGRVEELLLDVANVPFTRDAKGDLQLTLEASHNRARILYKADHTGRAIATSMVAAVRAHANITLVTGQSAIELLTSAQGECVGALTLAADGALVQYRAPFTLLATGGVGDVYANTSNPEGARGEGLALAVRAGATLRNMQYVQFHPTTLYMPNERRFLLTEALRGEGAILRDSAGRAFAKDYHPDGELAPRDVVARTILAEMEKQGESAPCMYLDISHKDGDWLRSRFPTIYAHCLARGLDMTTQPLPVVPAAHYHCGGVAVDEHGATSVPGLYAAGEVSCTGVHGANRLASTSLLEGLVWGCSAADHFLASQDQPVATLDKTSNASATTTDNEEDATDVLSGLCGTREPSANELSELLLATQRVMWEGVGPKRTVRGMASAVEKLTLLERRAETLYRECVVTRQSAGVRNAVRAAKEIAFAALQATRSVGTHYVIPEPASV